ncbi:MAG: ABC transporter ATP-binding protein [Bacillus sp. (in: firmicutes)]
MISVEHVSVQRNNKQILHDVSWNVQKGEHWCLLGLNGSGKTTLLNVLNGYLWPMKGKVEVLGQKFGQTNLGELRKDIGWVSSAFQQQFNDHDYVLEVVLSGKYASVGLYEHVEQADIERALQLLMFMDCEHLKGQDYGVISQGERQRVLIARALMSKPKLLILDEPCTGLDILVREHLLKYIERLATESDGPTIIYVTHHVEEIMPCFSHTLLMRNGEVFASGETKILLNESTLSGFFQHPLSVQMEQNRFWLALKND